MIFELVSFAGRLERCYSLFIDVSCIDIGLSIPFVYTFIRLPGAIWHV